MNYFSTSCPVVARGDETFVEHVTAGGARVRFAHVKPILWIQESTSQLLFKHGDMVLQEGATYNDWYGYLKSLRNHGGDRLCEHYSITPDSSLELVLMTTVMQSPATETAETIRENKAKPTNYKPTFLYVPQAWRKEIDDPDEPGKKLYRMLEPRILALEITWSSKNTPEQNAALAAEFIEKWKVTQ